MFIALKTVAVGPAGAAVARGVALAAFSFFGYVEALFALRALFRIFAN